MPSFGVFMAFVGLAASYCAFSTIHERRRHRAIYDCAHEAFMANPNKVENRVMWYSARDLDTSIHSGHFTILLGGSLLFVYGLRTLLAG